jgi:uncharacterized protein YlxW (UPF0749 family)
MRNLIFTMLLVLCLVVTASARQQPAKPPKKDTVRDLTKQHKQKIVKGEANRRRLQEEQIKYHEKQLKKVHDAQKEIDSETNRHIADSV